MAYTYHGTRNLITAPGRSVQTFPSGLVRVERTYICRRGDEARYRSELAVGNLLPNDEGSPSIDGLYIYPDPQEQTQDSGFTEFRVTAYGRTNTTGTSGAFSEVQSLTFETYYYTGAFAGYAGVSGGQGRALYSYSVIAKKITQNFVLRSDEMNLLYSSLIVPNENGMIAIQVTTINTSDPDSVLLDTSGVVSHYKIESSNFTNFGGFIECVISFTPEFRGTIGYRAK